MKTRFFVAVMLIVFITLILAGRCATQKQAYIPKPNEELYGTWVNMIAGQQCLGDRDVRTGRIHHRPDHSSQRPQAHC